MNTAVKENSSDIHIEALQKEFRVRFRIEGILKLYNKYPSQLFDSLISSLKILANLNIAEKRLPQDGSFSYILSTGKLIHARISSCPCILGEKIVIRILSNCNDIRPLDTIGLSKTQLKILRTYMKLPQGLILFTGSTGSGKTHTLYSMLKELLSPKINIMTLEDPIEIILEDTCQVTLTPAIKLDFKKILKSFLRQDPDIIMLGEIRDEESAKAAISAAQTGHLVLSSMHARDNIQAILRLVSFNINIHDLLSCLLLLSSQTLINLKEKRSAVFNFINMTSDTQTKILKQDYNQLQCV